MKQAIKKYQLELRVCGPVFVGDGSEIQKKEYIFLKGGMIGVIDVGKLYTMAKRRHLETELEQFMLTNSRKNPKYQADRNRTPLNRAHYMTADENLKQWVERNRIPYKELEDCFKYKIHTGDIQKEKSRMQIMSCIKDPYGNPYIPGSSIKGMLRTILLCDELLQFPEEYRREALQLRCDLREAPEKKPKKVLSQNIKGIEEKAFHTLNCSPKSRDAVNDKMRGIIVGDSEPVSTDNLILCQKWEQHTDGKYRAINVLRECLKPGTVIKADLTIDETVNPITPAQIQRAVKNFYDRYYEVFQRKFARQDRKPEQTVFLGGGCGFVSKTVVYSLLEEREAITTVQEILRKTVKFKGQQDLRLGVSPHILKCTKYQGKEYMMGECRLKIT